MIYTHPACLAHDPGPGHPECPERLAAVLEALAAPEFAAVPRIEAPLATRAQIARVHVEGLYDALERSAPASGRVRLDPDTAMSPGSWEAALRGAGAACAAVDAVVAGPSRRAFCAVRPPGHHATRDAPMGFCFFNNVAVGIRHALDVHGLERVALIDIDVHHGNGSEDILASDPRVLMASTFQRGLYPFLGDEPKGLNMVNVGLPAGAGGEQLRAAVQEYWMPALDAFCPQLVYISAGFDAHQADDMAGMRWVESDYAWVTRELVAVANRHCNGRVVSMLEGGYHLHALARSVAAHVRELVSA